MMPPPPQVKERCDALEIQIRWNEYMDFDVQYTHLRTRMYVYVCICRIRLVKFYMEKGFDICPPFIY